MQFENMILNGKWVLKSKIYFSNNVTVYEAHEVGDETNIVVVKMGISRGADEYAQRRSNSRIVADRENLTQAFNVYLQNFYWEPDRFPKVIDHRKLFDFECTVMEAFEHTLSQKVEYLKKLNTGTVMKIALESFKAIIEVHKIGFMHGKIMEENFISAYQEKQKLILLDFEYAGEMFFGERQKDLVDWVQMIIRLLITDLRGEEAVNASALKRFYIPLAKFDDDNLEIRRAIQKNFDEAIEIRGEDNDEVPMLLCDVFNNILGQKRQVDENENILNKLYEVVSQFVPYEWDGKHFGVLNRMRKEKM
ncbi:Choline/ethanolamine kinase [Gracilaria domingensis]|nr:Choline/ethanolamine kinase [Gracilaria domingensis]